jgi:hypothetical protein
LILENQSVQANFFGESIMGLLRCHQRNAAVTMLFVILIEEILTKCPAILNAAKTLRELGAQVAPFIELGGRYLQRCFCLEVFAMKFVEHCPPFSLGKGQRRSGRLSFGFTRVLMCSR